MRIEIGLLSDPRVIKLFQEHLDGMHANSPPSSVYALGLEDLQAPGVDLFTAWDCEDLLAIAALKALNDGTAEVKSMRTAPAHLRRGAAARLIEHIIATAKTRNYLRLSLETGSGPPFEPALQLYTKFGFRLGKPFGDYVPSEFNQFLHLDLR